ncbi:MAG: hypothetical protein HQ594_05720 [Candidatus Omnitrophica bacterium]|nr:hypothetical protein [Candidatus Omnitrophota bacterium]
MKKIFAGLLWLAGSVLAFFAIFTVAILSSKEIATFAVNHCTEYHLTYSAWDGSLFGRSDVRNANLQIPQKEIVLNIKNIVLQAEWRELFKNGRLKLACELDDTVLSPLGGENSFFENAGNGNNSMDSITDALFDPGMKYDQITFTLMSSASNLKITNFKALSRDVRIEGNYSYFRENGDVDVDIKISFSSEMSEKFGEDILKHVLSPDKDGWYSTSIKYRGNPVILKAVYSFVLS